MPERDRRLSPRVRRALSWLLPPVLAMAAIALQISLDVPKGEMLQREKTKKPRKSAATRTKLEKKRRKPRRFEPRSAKKIEALRAKWSKARFEDEPTDQQFRRQHESTLRSIATRTRSALLEGEDPLPLQIRPACRTIRCTLELCGPKGLLEDVAKTLPGITSAGRPLWHELREIESTRTPPKRPVNKNQLCRRWLIDFAIQAPKTTDLEIPIPKLYEE